MTFEALIVAIIIATAFLGESIFGFGGGLIAIPLLSLIIGVRDAVTLVLIFQLGMGVLIWKSHGHIDWRAAKPMTPWIIAGTIMGTLLLSGASTVFLQIFLASAIIAYLIKIIWFGRFAPKNESNVAAASISGLGGGLFQGLIGTGGPVLTMYLSAVTPQKLNMRATLIYLFFVTSLVRLGISVPQHLFTERILGLATLALPFFLIAITAGQLIHHKIDQKAYQLSINVILAISATVLIIRAVT